MGPAERAQVFINAVFEHIKHGDEQHEQWLKTELNKFTEGLTEQFELVEQIAIDDYWDKEVPETY